MSTWSASRSASEKTAPGAIQGSRHARTTRAASARLEVEVALAQLSARPQIRITGNEEKVSWDDAGKPLFLPPGKETVSVVDISNREAPRIVVSLPLMNSVFGAPSNLQITPDGK